MNQTKPSTLLTLTCDACHHPVTGNTGYICVDPDAVHQRRQRIDDWKTQNPGPLISGTALFSYPAAVPWHIYHRDCDPQLDSDNDYWFHVGRASTAADLLGWTAHMFDKDWFTDTGWDDFLYSVLNANGWRSP